MNPYLILTSVDATHKSGLEKLKVCIRTWNCHAYCDPITDIFGNIPEADIVVLALQESIPEFAYSTQIYAHETAGINTVSEAIRKQQIKSVNYSELELLTRNNYNVVANDFASFGLSGMIQQQGLTTLVLVKPSVHRKYLFETESKLCAHIPVDMIRNKGASLVTIKSKNFPLHFSFLNVHLHAHEGMSYVEQRYKDLQHIFNNPITYKAINLTDSKAFCFTCGDFNFRKLTSVDKLGRREIDEYWYWDSLDKIDTDWMCSEASELKIPSYKLNKVGDHLYVNPYKYNKNAYDSSRTPANTDRIFYGFHTAHALLRDKQTYKVLLKKRWMEFDNHCIKGYDAYIHSDHAPVEWTGSIEC